MLGVGRWGQGKVPRKDRWQPQAFLPTNGMVETASSPWRRSWGAPSSKMVPEPCSPSPVLQEFSKEERDPVKTHEGWGVMLPCNPPAHYPGKWGSWATARGGCTRKDI